MKLMFKKLASFGPQVLVEKKTIKRYNELSSFH